MQEPLLFSEKQKCLQSLVVILLMWIWILIPQLSLFGNTYTLPLWFFLFFIGYSLLFVILYFRSRLITSIGQDGIKVSSRKKSEYYPWDEIKELSIIKYNPLRYGGWGATRKREYTLFTASGDRAVQLVLTDGRKVIIGTRKPDEINSVLGKINHRNEIST